MGDVVASGCKITSVALVLTALPVSPPVHQKNRNESACGRRLLPRIQNLSSRPDLMHNASPLVFI
jgi:hypothetical protein